MCLPKSENKFERKELTLKQILKRINFVKSKDYYDSKYQIDEKLQSTLSEDTKWLLRSNYINQTLFNISYYVILLSTAKNGRKFAAKILNCLYILGYTKETLEQTTEMFNKKTKYQLKYLCNLTDILLDEKDLK